MMQVHSTANQVQMAPEPDDPDAPHVEPGPDGAEPDAPGAAEPANVRSSAIFRAIRCDKKK